MTMTPVVDIVMMVIMVIIIIIMNEWLRLLIRMGNIIVRRSTSSG